MTEQKISATDRFWRIDAVIVKVMKYLSYVPPICLGLMALLATINVIYSKLFSQTIPSTTDWISYLLIPAVFLSVGHVMLDRSLIAVDMISRKMPELLNKIILAISYVMAAGIGGFMAYRQFVLAGQYISIHKMSSTTMALAFPIWPFCVILGVGMLTLSFCLLWSIVRMFFKKPEKSQENAENGEQGG